MAEMTSSPDDFAGLEFAVLAFEELARKAEPRLYELLAERGVTSPRQLSRADGLAILHRALVETAALHMPSADIPSLNRVFRAVSNPLFFPAHKRADASVRANRDAFAPALGPDCAVVMAATGLPVAPLDKRTGKLLAPPSDDIDTVHDRFARLRTAFVGYRACAAPFYVLLTDSIRTLRECLPSDERLAAIRLLFARHKADLPPDDGQPFRHCCSIFPRQPGDMIASATLIDMRAAHGSVVLYAGWMDGAEPTAVLREDGYAPVPARLVERVLHRPDWAAMMTYPVGAPTAAPKIH